MMRWEASQVDASEIMGKLETLEKRKANLSEKLRAIQNSKKKDTDRILRAIAAQRWYWFENKSYVLMDRDTGLIWTDLNYFPYKDVGSSTLYMSYDKIKDWLLQHQKWGDFNWQLPHPSELLQLVRDGTFPFCGGQLKKIKGQERWLVKKNNRMYVKNLFERDEICESGMIGCYAILCCNDFVPENYVKNISSDNTYYTGKEKLQMTLDIFVNNGLILRFDDDSITKLYRQLYVDMPRLQKELEIIDSKIELVRQDEVVNTAKTIHAAMVDQSNY